MLIGLNGIGFILGVYITDYFTRSWDCSPIDQSNTFRNKIFLLFGWLYFVSKFADLLDTVFFILRKKKTHVTGLHVFHHFSMPLIGKYVNNIDIYTLNINAAKYLIRYLICF